MTRLMLTRLLLLLIGLGVAACEFWPPTAPTPPGTTVTVDIDNRAGGGTGTGGDADTVWCRPRSDCNGEGGNRTAVNTASPPAAWIADASAVFRRSGSTGTTVTFTVDGVTLTHDFSTGG